MTPSPGSPALEVQPLEESPRDRTRLATLSLRISAVLYILLGLLVAMVPFTWDPVSTEQYGMRSVIMGLLAVLCIGLAILALCVVRGLRRRKRWAWRTALVLFMFYLPSALLPLGAVGMFGLLSEGTRSRFPVPRSDNVRRMP